MRVGIDATCWANTRGYGRFTRELVEAMVAEGRAHEFVCFLDELSAAGFSLKAPNLTTVIVDQGTRPTAAAASGSRRGVRDMLRLTAAVRRAGLDAFLSPSVYGYFPLPPGLPAVVTVHDAIAERHPKLALHTWKDRWSWRARVRLALMQARVFLTVSDYAAREVSTHLGVPPDRLRVTLEGVSQVFRPSRSEVEVQAAADRARIPVGASWFTYVGGFGRYRNVENIVRAHAEVVKRRPERRLMLVLVGQHENGSQADVSGIREVARRCGTEHLLRWVGFLPDTEVRHLHCGALALI